MQKYVVSVYRAHAEDTASVSGIFEDTESGQIETFQTLEDLQSLLAQSIEKNRFKLPNGLAPAEVSALDHVNSHQSCTRSQLRIIR
jgi:hypothetical protein